jgi:hypothetical protein
MPMRQTLEDDDVVDVRRCGRQPNLCSYSCVWSVAVIATIELEKFSGDTNCLRMRSHNFGMHTRFALELHFHVCR